jgi:hypothetical protein
VCKHGKCPYQLGKDGQFSETNHSLHVQHSQQPIELPPHPPPTGNEFVKMQIRQVISEATVPSWFQKPPAHFGESGVGAIKTSEWQNLFTLYIPFALIGLWLFGTNSILMMRGISAKEDLRLVYKKILEVTMHLVVALNLMNKRSQSKTRSDAFRAHLADWYKGVQEIWQDVKAKANSQRII